MKRRAHLANLLAVFVAGSFLAACGGGDSTRPTVASTFPAGGATSVSISAAPTITFSEAMDTSSLDASRFILQSHGGVVSTGVSYNATAKKAIISHAALLAHETEYTVTVSGEVKDLAGNTMGEDDVFIFTTGQEKGGTMEWSNPLPQGNDLHSVWSLSATDVFAVGDNGTILRSNGTSWSLMESNTASDLWGVWGSSASDVSAVGSEGVVMHFDGSTWSPAYISPEAKTLLSVWGSSSTDVFASGQGGTIFHWNGSEWSAQESGSESNVQGIWGFSGSDVYAVDLEAMVLHYDGEGWSIFKDFGDKTMCYAVWGSSPSDLYVGGLPWEMGYQLFHYDGADWSGVGDVRGPIGGIWGSSASDIFAVGRGGTLYHYDGTDWNDMSFDSIDYAATSGSSSSDVYTVGDYGSLDHYDGTRWSVQSGTSVWYWTGIWGGAANDLYAVGQDGVILHFDGASWAPADSPISRRLNGISGSAANNIYAVGCHQDITGYVIHYDGTSWSIVRDDLDNCLGEVWVSSDDNVFAIGRNKVERYDGAVWHSEDISSRRINGISGSSKDNVIVVGNEGMAYRFNGTRWEELSTGTADNLLSVMVISETEAYAGDQFGNLFSFDGTTWTVRARPVTSAIESLWGTSGEDLYLIALKEDFSQPGPFNILLYYDGENFLQLDNLSEPELFSVWGPSADHVYFVGNNGVILHHRP